MILSTHVYLPNLRLFPVRMVIDRGRKRAAPPVRAYRHPTDRAVADQRKTDDQLLRELPNQLADKLP